MQSNLNKENGECVLVYFWLMFVIRAANKAEWDLGTYLELCLWHGVAWVHE